MKVTEAALVVAAGLFLGPIHAAGRSQEPPVQVVEMTAKKYEYSPDEIHVKVGIRVQLKVRALDRAHGLKVDLYPKGEPEEGPPGLKFVDERNNVRVEKNEVQVLEFVAERPGRYQFECSVFCGLGHHGMDGWLIVESATRSLVPSPRADASARPSASRASVPLRDPR